MKFLSTLFLLVFLPKLTYAGAIYDRCVTPIEITDADLERDDFDSYAEDLDRKNAKACADVQIALEQFKASNIALNLHPLIVKRRQIHSTIRNLTSQMVTLGDEIANKPPSVSSEFSQSIVSWSKQRDSIQRSVNDQLEERKKIIASIDYKVLAEIVRLKASGLLSAENEDRVTNALNNVEYLESEIGSINEIVLALSSLLETKKSKFVDKVRDEIDAYIANASRPLFARLDAIEFEVKANSIWGSATVTYVVLRFEIYGLYKSALSYLDNTESVLQKTKSNLAASSAPAIVSQINTSQNTITRFKQKITDELNADKGARARQSLSSLWSQVQRICKSSDPKTVERKAYLAQRIKDAATLDAMVSQSPALAEVSQLNTEMIVVHLLSFKDRCEGQDADGSP